MGVGVGQCLVCNHESTAAVAAEEAENQIYLLRWADGCSRPLRAPSRRGRRFTR